MTVPLLIGREMGRYAGIKGGCLHATRSKRLLKRQVQRQDEGYVSCSNDGNQSWVYAFCDFWFDFTFEVASLTTLLHALLSPPHEQIEP